VGCPGLIQSRRAPARARDGHGWAGRIQSAWEGLPRPKNMRDWTIPWHVLGPHGAEWSRQGRSQNFTHRLASPKKHASLPKNIYTGTCTCVDAICIDKMGLFLPPSSLGIRPCAFWGQQHPDHMGGFLAAESCCSQRPAYQCIPSPAAGASWHRAAG
jgi:hypothetical protein